jgi:hypothetical protein
MLTQNDTLSWFDIAEPSIQILVSDFATLIDKIERGEATKFLQLFDSLSLLEASATDGKFHVMDTLQATEDARTYGIALSIHSEDSATLLEYAKDARAYGIVLNIHSEDSATLSEDAFTTTRLRALDQIQTTDR